MRPAFIGQTPHSLDPKNRLFIPQKFRDELRKEDKCHFILTSGLEACLFLSLPSAWERFLSDGLSANMENKDEERAFKRKLLAEAIEVNVDSQGRILIPQLLRNYARLKKDVFVNGAGNRAEIWDQSVWSKYRKTKADPSFRKIAPKLDI